ncbi:CRISPR-associated endoribonuclease Cas6 [Caldibacillus thermoamylovorans]|uniref:CRISPR-associated endoribonuclease Cas6 n=1 Tax=Caldibacillus thermoamylovorans TaxID=35841 RepID=UPI00203FC8E8|nr:CRISPR-associated endoribonuclease Cas6 [Caldibacillus thermoamylovorans]MCM3053621.1 CRISPR-associated endoribonuclease Cas6 [Caldibacillus thermoamylovorans]
MRLKVTISFDKNGLALPMNYQQILQGFIYRQLDSDLEFRAFLHENGYKYEKRRFKAFTFSRLFGKTKYNKESKQIIFYGPVTWYIGSAIPKFIQLLGQSLLLKDDLHINYTKISIDEIQYEKEPQIKDNKIMIKMLSPITMYSTFENHEGKKLTQYFSPFDPEFSFLIGENSRKKYEAFFQEAFTDHVQITPVSIQKHDKVVTKFKSIYITAWNGIYELEGPIPMLNFLYNSAIGGKNSQGFGMFEILKQN